MDVKSVEFRKLAKLHTHWHVNQQESAREHKVVEQATDAMTSLFERVNEELEADRFKDID